MPQWEPSGARPHAGTKSSLGIGTGAGEALTCRSLVPRPGGTLPSCRASSGDSLWPPTLALGLVQSLAGRRWVQASPKPP